MPATIIIASSQQKLYQITAKDGGPLVMVPLYPNCNNPENLPYFFFDADTCTITIPHEGQNETYISTPPKFVGTIPPRHEQPVIKDTSKKERRIDPEVVAEALGGEVVPEVVPEVYFNSRRLKKPMVACPACNGTGNACGTIACDICKAPQPCVDPCPLCEGQKQVPLSAANDWQSQISLPDYLDWPDM